MSGCTKASGAMQASGIQAFFATAAALGILCSSGFSLVTSEATLCCDGTGRSFRPDQSSLFAMVGGVSPAKILQEKAKMWPSSVVLFA